MAKKTAPGRKKLVNCMYCGGAIEVSLRAMSVFCPHCNKRVVCEDYTIKSYRAVRHIATCGEVVIERKGHVVAPITATSLLIRGVVRGKITGKRVVVIEGTGVVEGDVEAPRLILQEGARINGRCSITQNGQVDAKQDNDSIDATSKDPSTPPTKAEAQTQSSSEATSRDKPAPPRGGSTNGANGMSSQAAAASSPAAVSAQRAPRFHVTFSG